MIATNSLFNNHFSTISKKCNNPHTEYKNFNLEDDNDLIGQGGNNSKATTTSDSGDNSLSEQRVHVPDNIHVSSYLKDYLKTLVLPNQIDNKFLIKVGEDALKSKMEYVEEHNMMYKKLKKRVPDKLNFDEVAVIMMSLFTFRNIQMTERVDDTLLAVYDQDINSPKFGTYNSSREYFYQIMERLGPSFKQYEMEDVIHKIKRVVPMVEPTKERHLFAVNNGIYSQQSKRLMPFNDQYVYLTKIPIDYKLNPINPLLTAPDGYRWDIESWFCDITDNDADTIKLLWQVIADCLQPNYSRHKSIWFYSEKGNNGKGTVGQLIKNLLGKGNYGSLSVADFNHEFMKSTLLGVAANIADENDVDMFIDSVKDYKASITGDDMNINRKYEQPLRIQFNGTNIQMMNGLPKTKDKSESFYRRIILVPFLKSFTNNGERKYIKNDYINQKEVLEYVLHKALSINFDEYIVPQRSSELLDQYREKNNPVMEFWNQLKDEFSWGLLPTQFLYDLYLKWDEKNNPSGKAMAKRNVIEQLRNVISSQGDPWEDRTSKSASPVRSNKRMDDDEPLISEYGLDIPEVRGKPSEWMHPSYNGTNGVRKREFTRRMSYRGFVRI
ncbi:phage/plasmid primase, P4 family [Halobacillus sp. A1]|uniref:DNA primase family protein n=1 Tax=Halobacillus sp. A1 TaxID=2880262 RepID=UPI0020A6CE23|nr:phage/plasmid primase, P4 family [Halobacillus sp. A1]MCP3033454.1 phage/plasmid primase, P4 family [Halobacillus sp. A1]